MPNFIFLFFTVLFEFSDFELILFVIIEVISFDGLNFDMVFVLKLRDLHVLDMLDVCDFLLKFLDLVE